MTEPSRIVLDPAEAARLRARRQRRLNVTVVPAARAAGNLLLLACVALHNAFILGEWDPARFWTFAAALLAYSLLAWLALRAWYDRWPALAPVFMTLDIVAWTFAIYVSGGDRSWLWPLLIMRAADQRLAGFRAVLAYGHVSVACYALMLAGLALAEGRPVSWPAEGAKLAIAYGFNLYLAATARAVADFRATLVAAIRVAREMLARRNEALASLGEREESYRVLFETVNDPIMVVGLDGRITAVNRALEAASGYARDELVGRHFHALTTPGVAAVSDERLRRAIAGEPLPPTEVVGIHKNGARVPYEVRTAILRDRDGRPTGAVGIYRDMSRHKEIEETLERAKELAEDANRAKTQFLANMSHELRTPLNSIIGFTKLLLRRLDGDLTSRQEAYVRSAHDSGTHLLQLINSVLDLSRIESGKQELTIDAIDVATLVEECLEATRPLALGRRLALERDVPGTLPPLYGDRLKLKQVLLNLLSNAVKFTPAGRVLVSVRPKVPGLEFTVTDTGVGITDADVPRLFQAFQRLDTPLAREAGGTGLGLAISKLFVELHGGRVWVDSREGHGSTFGFMVPFEPRA